MKYVLTLLSMLLFGNPAWAGHECNKGPVDLVYKTTSYSYDKDKKATCSLKSTWTPNDDGSYSEPSREFYTISGNTIMWDGRPSQPESIAYCRRTYRYTDWPECGGERMYPVDKPTEYNPDATKCGCCPYDK